MGKIKEQIRHWVVIWQARNAEQFDFTTMKVIDCWRDEGDYKTAYAEMGNRAAQYASTHGDGKISLLEGDRQANYLWPYSNMREA
jgi:hypothetical protein